MQKLVFINVSLICLFFLSAPAHARPDRIVLGYSAAWRDPQTPPECYNYDSITHIARSFLVPHPDGEIEVPAGFFNESMESLARKHGVKLLMSLGGSAPNADNWLSIARNPKYFQRFCDDLSNLLKQHGYDGIDIDWEPSAITTEDGSAYVSLLKGLRARFPDRILTTALGASEYWIGHFSWKEVTDNVDYVNVMTYDYSGGWGGRAAYCSSLFPASAYSPEPNLSDAEGMQNLIDHHKVSPAKLLLGITFWPCRFSVKHIGDHFPVNGPGYSMSITRAQAMCLLGTGDYTDFWDEKAAMPYMERKQGDSVICYENPKSIERKCQYAAKLGCPGVMIWHLGADVYGNSAPLMDTIAQSCGAPKQVFSSDIIAREILDYQNEMRRLKSPKGEAVDAPSDQSISQVLVDAEKQLPQDQLQQQLIEAEKDWASQQDLVWLRDDPRHTSK